MRNNETGEFELVVGNKQLLSGFFIVVLLFAVAFAMGYVVGQNTQRPAKLASESGGASTAAGNAANTVAADSRPQPASPLTPAPVPLTPAAPDAATGQQPPSEATSPATPQPATHPATQPATHPATQPARASQPATGEKAAAAPATTGIVGASELPPGSFWQAIAVKPEVAEAIRQTLKDKGFPVSLTQGTSNLTRVLVGPYSDTSAYGRAKTELENAGFRPVRYRRD
jgi:cell division septation protein DedD